MPNTDIIEKALKLAEEGNTREAIILLTSNPRVEAELLKAELCLKAKTEPKFLGNLVVKYQKLARKSQGKKDIISGTTEWMKEELLSARKDMLNEEYRSMYRHLQTSEELAPQNLEQLIGQARVVFERLSNQPEKPSSDLFSKGLKGLGRLTLVRDGREALTKTLKSIYELEANPTTIWVEAKLMESKLHEASKSFDKVFEIIAELQTLDLAETVTASVENLQHSTERSIVSHAIENLEQSMRLKRLNADHILINLLKAHPSTEVWLLAGEWLSLKGHMEQSQTCFLWAMEADALLQNAQVDKLKALFQLSKNISHACRDCKRTMGATTKRCSKCKRRVPETVLIKERFKLTEDDLYLHSQIGLIETLTLRGASVEAMEIYRALLDDLSDDYAQLALIETLYPQIEVNYQQDVYQHRVQDATASFIAGDVSGAADSFRTLADSPLVNPEVLGWATVVMVAEGSFPEWVVLLIHRSKQLVTSDWQLVPYDSRRQLLENLCDRDLVYEVRAMVPVLFSEEELEHEMSQRVLARFELELMQIGQEAISSSEQALADEQLEEALAHVNIALDLSPNNNLARFTFARIMLAEGSYFQALKIFHDLSQEAEDETIRLEASIEYARTQERMGNLSGALETLNAIDHENQSAQALRERVEARLYNYPFVQVSPIGEREEQTLYQAVFAIAIRATTRLEGMSRQYLLRTAHEFISVLGSLADNPGQPAIELRMIGDGKNLRLVFVFRLIHTIPEKSEHLALELSSQLLAHLPLVKDHIYQYELVYDKEELDDLLHPFEINDGVEVSRVGEQIGDAFAAHPFSSSGTTLWELAELIADHEVMLSVQIKPTQLQGHEQKILNYNIELLRRIHLFKTSNTDEEINEEERQSMLLLPDGNQMQLSEMLRQIKKELERHPPFLMRVMAASKRPNDKLTLQAVSTRMFGANGMYHLEPAKDIEEFRRDINLLHVDEWVDPVEDNARLKYLFSATEVSWIFRLPIPELNGLPGLPQLNVKAVLPERLPLDGIVLGESLTNMNGLSQQIRIKQSDRRRHINIIGKTGVGKSTLIESMVLQDMRAGKGLVLIDPHGDLIDEILSRIPPNRADDVVIFDPSDEEYPIGFNFLEAKSRAERFRIATEFVQLLVRKYSADFAGPIFQQAVTMAILTATEAIPGATLLEVVRVLSDYDFAKTLIDKITDPVVKTYWEKQQKDTSDYDRSRLLAYVISKFNRFTGDLRVRRIIGQSKSSIDFRQIMDEKRILLINLSKGKIGEETSTFLGGMMLNSILGAALGRSDIHVSQRNDFMVYIDEFHAFASEKGIFASMLAEGRKYGINLVMASQYIHQVPERVRAAIFGNVGSLVAFNVGFKDAHILAQEFHPTFTASDLLNLPRFTAAVRLLVDGTNTSPFAMQTRLDDTAEDPAIAARIRQMSRLKYSRNVHDVEKEIAARF